MKKIAYIITIVIASLWSAANAAAAVFKYIPPTAEQRILPSLEIALEGLTITILITILLGIQLFDSRKKNFRNLCTALIIIIVVIIGLKLKETQNETECRMNAQSHHEIQECRSLNAPFDRFRNPFLPMKALPEN